MLSEDEKTLIQDVKNLASHHSGAIWKDSPITMEGRQYLLDCFKIVGIVERLSKENNVLLKAAQDIPVTETADHLAVMARSDKNTCHNVRAEISWALLRERMIGRHEALAFFFSHKP